VSDPLAVASERSEQLNEQTAPDLSALDRSMLSSIAWTGAAKWTVQALSWASTIVIVRLLSPTDYGVVGMAGAFLAMLQPICDLGIGAAIVQGRQLTANQIARLNGFAILLGFVCSAVTAMMAGPVASFFREPALEAAVRAMGVMFFIGAFRVIPTALLARDMAFRRLAFIETAEAVVLMLTTLGLAVAGFGYWSLIVGPITSKTIGSALAIHANPYRIAFPRPFMRISDTVRFGAWVATSTLAWYLYANADRIVVGRLLGEAALGAYSIGITLAAMPVDKIGQLYQRVSESVIARVQGEPAAVARYLLRISEGVSMITFPVSIGLALVADQFVEVVLGARWEMAVTPLRLLAAAAALRSLDPLLAQILIATGNVRQNARSMIIAALLLPGAFLLGAHWGLAGIAGVWLVGHPLIVMTRQVWCALRVADARFIDYLRALWPATSGTAVMAVAVIGVRALVHHHAPAPVALAASVATGALAYVAALVLMHPQRLRVAREFIRPKDR
jgi:O-antigen/teichoic acid export membrane protein